MREHAFGVSLSENLNLADPENIEEITGILWPDKSSRQRKKILNRISKWKSLTAGTTNQPEFEQYQEALRERNLFDYDDLIGEAVTLLEQNDALRRKLQLHYKHIFVDEYQDVNAIQHKLLKLLLGDFGRLTAIGDPNQAIYGFRGSDVQFFAMFSDEFDDSVVLHLSDNYRSAQNLLNASGQVIHKNRFPGLPPLTAKIAAKGRLTIHETPTEKSEAEYVVHQIEKMVGGLSMFSQDSGRVISGTEGERSFGDFAVLYRLNAQRRALEEAFERSGIPFQISGDAPLIQHPGVVELMTFLKLAAEEAVRKNDALKVLQKLIVGFGPAAVKSVQSFLDASERLSRQNLSGLLTKDSPLRTNLIERFETFLDGLDETKHKIQELGVKNALQHLALISAWQRLLVENESINKSWRQLVRLASLHDTMQEFTDAVYLQRDFDQFDRRAERVSLMTMHASKGLEFPVVFIVGCEQNLIPLHLEGFETESAEERRIFYVGMTRAKEELTLVRAKSRMLFGKKLKTTPSPFIGDISEQLKAYERHARRANSKKQEKKSQLELFG